MNFLQRTALSLSMALQKAAGAVGTQLPYLAESRYGRAYKVTDWDAEGAVSNGLKASTWVYAGVRQIARAMSSIPLNVMKWDGKQYVPDPEHPVQILLDKLNPVFTRQQLMERWAYHINLSGDGFWYLNTGSSNPTAPVLEVWPINPHEIKPIPDRKGWVSGYEYKPRGGQKQEIPAHQVAHWMFTDPLNPYSGLSPLQAAARAIDTDIAAAAWNSNALNNAGIPPVAVLLEGKLTPEEQRKASDMIGEQIAGQRNARKAIVMAAVRDIKPLALSAAELDWLEGRRFSKEEIGAVLGVPSVLLSAGQDVTFTNLDAAKAIFWEDTVIPLLDQFCQGLTLSVMPHFNAMDTHIIQPDLSGVPALLAKMKERAETAQILINAGWPQNMVNERLQMGFPAVKGGDVPRVPQPLSSVPAASKSFEPFEFKDEREDGVQIGTDKQRAKWEQEMTRRFQKVLGDQGDALAEAFLSGGWEAVPRETQREVLLILTAMHQTIIEEVGVAAYKALTDLVGVQGAFDVLNPAVTDWIEEHSLESAKSIAATSRNAAAAIIQKGTEDGLSRDEIGRMLRDKFETLSKSQAETIAITEVNSAFANGNHLGASQFSDDHGITIEKRWRSASDSRTRDTHKSLNGKQIPMDQDFKPSLAYPHDPRAPAAEVIRCRCVVQYIPVEDA